MSGYDNYQTPLASRYASPEMTKLFSARHRHSTWRLLWLHLASCQRELGLKRADGSEVVTAEALDQMRAHLEVSDEAFAVAAEREKAVRHDVMAHVYAFGKDAPAAEAVIHAGATSCYVTDNTELILMRDGLDLLLPKLAKALDNLRRFALQWRDTPTLGYTHYQPAQMITVGKRAAQWAQELLMDLEDIEHVRNGLLFRGAQGTTGTQASFMELFHGDGDKIDRLNEMLCERTGFPGCYPVSTQTYTRKVDLRVANALAGLGATVQRITTDIRHLANMKELEEPFEKEQIGSSAMAYKRNPMRSERIASLGRKLASLPANFSSTFASQWAERTLDDSAIRRIDIPEMFLLADAILIALDNVTDGLVVYPRVIDAHARAELPFMATENIIMKMVALGASRQEAHEQIRVLAHEASAVVKLEGKPNDMIDRIKRTEFFRPVWETVDEMLDPKLYIGRCPTIVDRFCEMLDNRLAPYKEHIRNTAAAKLTV